MKLFTQCFLSAGITPEHLSTGMTPSMPDLPAQPPWLMVNPNFQNKAQDLELPGTFKHVLMNNLDTLDLDGSTLHMPGYQVVILEL